MATATGTTSPKHKGPQAVSAPVTHVATGIPTVLSAGLLSIPHPHPHPQAAKPVVLFSPGGGCDPQAVVWESVEETRLRQHCRPFSAQVEQRRGWGFGRGGGMPAFLTQLSAKLDF